MVPLILLVISVLVFWLAGRAGIAVFQDPSLVLRTALGLMFLFTASAHWGKRRPDLIRMVPPQLPHPPLLVTITGILEILGAIGLFVSRMAPVACIGLALLLLVLFPANIRAARQNLTIGGQPVLSWPIRGVIQLVFIATLIAAAWLK
jgi:uncharacterized membrane protein